MRGVLISIMFCLVFAACSDGVSEHAQSTDTTEVPTTVTAAQPSPAPPGGEVLHRQMIDAVNAGDIDGVLALFHDDTNVWNAFGCSPNCHGLAKFREALQAVTANHWRFDGLTIEELRTSYTTWTASRVELRGDDITNLGLERVRAGFAVAARDGKIASVRGAFDPTDEETRRFTSQAPRTAPVNPPPPPEPEGQYVDVGGRRIYMECMGDADPTVIFEGGANAVRGPASSRLWAGANGLLPHVLIQQEVAKVARACAYDPAGVALSDPRPRPSTGRADAEDMHRLLHAAGFAPPYVVVGNSYGAQVAQLFASMYPDETAGIVLLDATPGWEFSERFAEMLPAESRDRFWTGVRQSWEQAKTPQGLAGGTDLEATLNELREMTPLPDVPLAVLTAGIPLHPWNVAAGLDVQQREQIRYDVQAALAQLTPRGTHRIVDNSEHGMTVFAPDLIAEAIRDVVRQARR